METEVKGSVRLRRHDVMHVRLDDILIKDAPVLEARAGQRLLFRQYGSKATNPLEIWQCRHPRKTGVYSVSLLFQEPPNATDWHEVELALHGRHRRRLEFQDILGDQGGQHYEQDDAARFVGTLNSAVALALYDSPYKWEPSNSHWQNSQYPGLALGAEYGSYWFEMTFDPVTMACIIATIIAVVGIVTLLGCINGH